MTALPTQVERSRTQASPRGILSSAFGRSASPNVSRQPPPASGNPSGFMSPGANISRRTLSPSRSLNSTSSRPSSSPTTRKKGAASPVVVSSIINNMYAYPSNRPQDHPAQLHSGEPLRRSASAITSVSSSLSPPLQPPPSGIVRSATMLSPQVLPTTPSSWTFGDSVSHATPLPPPATLNRAPVSKLFPETLRTFSDVSHASSTSMDSVAKGAPSEGNSSSNSLPTGSGSTMRVVGRGGTGSRPRVAAPPKPIVIKPPPQQERPAFVRPMGRGGLGSRQKPINEAQASPAFLAILKIRSKKKDAKGKGKAEEQHGPMHPISPNLAYQIVNGSNSTLSTIHFIGESSSPPPRFFPSGRSVGSDESGLSPPPSATSSTFSRTLEDSSIYDESRCSTPDVPRTRNVSKLARTLGDLPTGAMYEAILMQRGESGLPRLVIDNSDGKPTTRAMRRASISLSSLSSMFVRPTPHSRIRDSTASHQSMSTLTSEDLHRFDMNDQLSESWGERDSVYRSDSPGSPIMFSAPSPIPPTSKKVADSDAESIVSTPPLDTDMSSPTTPTTMASHTGESEASISTLALSTPALSRSHSLTRTSRSRGTIRVAGHGHSTSTSTSLLEESPDAGLRSESPSPAFLLTSAIRPDWLIPPEQEEEVGEMVFAIRGEIPEKRQQAWTGEWNTDMKDVIRALRELR